MRTKLFLASSSELEEDRKEFEILINRKNKDWVDRGAFLELVVWEDFLDALSKTRLQDEYNKAIRGCDVFVMLFCTKVGKYTEEEFETAFGQFKATNKPLIYTYFKDAEITTASANKDDLTTLWAFQEKLNALGHFYTGYKNVDALKFHFNQQLDKLVEKGFIKLIDESQKDTPSVREKVQGRYLGNDLAEVNAWKSSGGRPFDVIVIGGGTFGAAIAEHIWFRQKQTGGGLRTLVVEAGLFTIPDPFTPFNLNENAPQPDWDVWSPRLLDEEMTTWPAQTVADLNARYFGESTRQIGVDETNDFIFGELHNALRQRLFDNLGAVAAAIPLSQLPPSPLLKGGEQQEDLWRMLGLDSAGTLTMGDLRNLLKLEAPLGVQSRSPHAGFFPLNKFSTVPLLMKAARTAFSDFSPPTLPCSRQANTVEY